MCGIFGYIGNNGAKNIVLQGLELLEYRGYDSSGICVYNNNQLQVHKKKGRVVELKHSLKDKEVEGNIAIGHTRWATHGVPSDVNSHPHLSNNKKIAIVHNGILENYLELKEFLEKKGYVFYSQTDSEVIANLIEYYHNEMNMLATIKKIIPLLEGSYAIVVLNSNNNGEIVSFKKDNPIVITNTNNEYYLSSDSYALAEYNNQFYYLEDNEIAIIKDQELAFYNQNLDTIKKVAKDTPLISIQNNKKHYDSFMLKEINEQSQVLQDIIDNYIMDDEIILFKDIFTQDYLAKIKKIYIVGCGTSYFAGVNAMQYLKMCTNFAVDYVISSEFSLHNYKIDSETLVVVISQSGETADTIGAIKYAKTKNAKIFALINTPFSSIERLSDFMAYTYAGKEISVASTKAFSSQYLVLVLFSLYFMKIKGEISATEYKRMILEVKKLPSQAIDILSKQEEIFAIASNFYEEKNMFFMARGEDFFVAQEGSLKMKEVSYIHSESIYSGELKHGSIALIKKGFPIINIISQKELFKKAISSIKEVKARGAYVINFITEDVEERDKISNIAFIIPRNIIAQGILSNIPLQLLAYKTASLLGNDIDKPKNLAKSVTVE